MADAPVVHIGENSPEEVAFKLFRIVAQNDDVRLAGVANGSKQVDRDWILDTYSECLKATKFLR